MALSYDSDGLKTGVDQYGRTFVYDYEGTNSVTMTDAASAGQYWIYDDSNLRTRDVRFMGAVRNGEGDYTSDYLYSAESGQAFCRGRAPQGVSPLA